MDNTQNDDGHNKERNETSNLTLTETEGPKQKSTRPKKRSKMNERDDLTDNAISEALTLLQQCASDNISEKNDPYNVYGQYIGNELRKYDKITLAHVKNAINKIIFDADMGAYSGYGYYTQSYGEHDNLRYMSHPSSSSTPSTYSLPAASPMPSTSPMPPALPMPPSSSMPSYFTDASCLAHASYLTDASCLTNFDASPPLLLQLLRCLLPRPCLLTDAS
ncbi:hypothetical protein ACJJTC_008077 [Scirpophaga incertulas]